MQNHTHANGRRWAALSLAVILLSAPPALAQSARPLRFTARPGAIPAGKTRDVKITTEDNADLSGSEFEMLPPPADTGVSIDKPQRIQLTDENRALVARVTVDEDAEPQTVPLLLLRKQNGNVVARYTVELSVTEFRPQTIRRQATPPDLNRKEEAVDYMLQPLSYKATKDVYGSRVADAYVAVVIGLGNNTGFDLQITKVGFVTPKIIDVRALDQNGEVALDQSGKVKTYKQFLQVAAVDRTLVRGSVEREQNFGKRALAMNLIAGTGMLTTGFLPFFHALGPRANFSSLTSIVNGQLKEGFNTAVPDLTIRQLNRLENNLVMHEEFILPNNSERTTVVFVPRAALDFELDGADGVHDADGVGMSRKERMKRERDDLTLIRQKLGHLTIVGRFVERYANREIVVRTGAAGETARPSGERTTGAPRDAELTSPFDAASGPTIQLINPNNGPTGGGTTITIVGSNFLGVTSVTVGGAPATNVRVINANTISATTPGRATEGAVNVVVTTAAGVSSQPFANGFVYTTPPPAPSAAPSPAPTPPPTPAPSPTPE